MGFGIHVLFQTEMSSAVCEGAQHSLEVTEGCKGDLVKRQKLVRVRRVIVHTYHLHTTSTDFFRVSHTGRPQSTIWNSG
jgi:hypothetical protein